MKHFGILVAALAGAACSKEDPGRLPFRQEPVSVVVSSEQRAATFETFAAVIEAERSAEIATRMSGTVTSVMVDVGSRVARGETLLTVDAVDVTAALAAARAELDLAERSFRRIDNLAADGAASQQELDRARASVEAARAGVATAEAQEAYAVVRSPFSGVVRTRDVDPGDLAVPGRPLLTVVSPGSLKVVADLPAQRADALLPGVEIPVQIAGIDAVLPARITRVSPALAPRSRTRRVEATPVGSWEGVMTGAYARLILSESSKGPGWLPEDAIVRRGQLTGVYSVEADTLRLRWIRLGQERNGAVEVLAGPARQLTVVRDPAADLSDGIVVADARIVEWRVPDTGDVERVGGAIGTEARR
jgi:RND family efflux transporter MFP subunit